MSYIACVSLMVTWKVKMSLY